MNIFEIQKDSDLTILWVDARELAAECGWLLGRTCARIEQLCRSVLPPAVAAALREDVRIRGTLALTTLGGNTLGETVLRQLLTGQRDVPPSRQYLRQELFQQVAALEAVDGAAREGIAHLLVSALLALHDSLLRDSPLPDAAAGGVLKSEAQPLLAQLARLLTELSAPLHEAFSGLGSGLVRAILAHRQLLWLRPFAAGNGRVARLVEQAILRQSGIPATASLLLPIHYQLTQSAYRARLSDPPDEEGVLSFLRYALQGLHDGVEELLDRLDESHLDTHWLRHVHSLIGDNERSSYARKNEIMMEISEIDTAIKRDQIPQLSPKLATFYASLTDRTLRRDVQDLLRLGLLVESGARLRAYKEQLYAFLPDGAETG